MSYDFSKANLETADGIRYNLDWAINGMNKFDNRQHKSKEYKIFKAVFLKAARKVSSEKFSHIII